MEGRQRAEQRGKARDNLQIISHLTKGNMEKLEDHSCEDITHITKHSTNREKQHSIIP